MLPRHSGPLAPRRVARQGPPRPVSPAQLSLTAISRKIITPRSHTYGTSYLQNIYFNMCQGLLGLQAEPLPPVQAAGVGLPSPRRAVQAEGLAGSTLGGWAGLGDPSCTPQAVVSPLLVLWGRGSAVSPVPGCS